MNPPYILPGFEERITKVTKETMLEEIARKNVWVPVWWSYPPKFDYSGETGVEEKNLENMESWWVGLKARYSSAKEAGSERAWRKLADCEVEAVSGDGSINFHLSPFIEEGHADIVMPPAKYQPLSGVNLIDEKGQTGFSGRYGSLVLENQDKVEVYTIELVAIPEDSYGQGTTNSTNARKGLVATANSFGLNPGWAGQVKLELEYRGISSKKSRAIVPIGSKVGQAYMIPLATRRSYSGPYSFQNWYTDIENKPPVDLEKIAASA